MGFSLELADFEEYMEELFKELAKIISLLQSINASLQENRSSSLQKEDGPA